MSILTEELKNFVVKKHNKILKLNLNKKSVQNLKKYQLNVSNLFKDIISNNKSVNVLPNEVRILEKNLKKLEMELEGDEERILTKSIERSESPGIIKNTDPIHITNPDYISKQTRISLNEIPLINKAVHKDEEKDTIKAVILPSIGYKQTLDKTYTNSKKVYKKYDYITLNKNKVKPQESSNYNPHYKKEVMNTSPGKTSNVRDVSPKELSTIVEKKHKTLVINDWDPILEFDDLQLKVDYDNVSDIDFKKIIKRTELLLLLKEKVEKGLKEKEKIYEKKFKGILNIPQRKTRKS